MPGLEDEGLPCDEAAIEAVPEAELEPEDEEVALVPTAVEELSSSELQKIRRDEKNLSDKNSRIKRIIEYCERSVRPSVVIHGQCVICVGKPSYPKAKSFVY